jgi:chromosome segregation ATPase
MNDDIEILRRHPERNSEVQAACDRLERLLAMHEDNIERLRRVVVTKQVELTEMQERLAATQEELELQVAEQQRLRAENTKAEEAWSISHEACQKLEAEVERLRKEVRLWQGNYPKDLTERLLKYEAVIERLREENRQLKHDGVFDRAEVERLQYVAEVANLQAIGITYRRRALDAEAEVKRLRTENERLRGLLAEALEKPMRDAVVIESLRKKVRQMAVTHLAQEGQLLSEVERLQGLLRVQTDLNVDLQVQAEEQQREVMTPTDSFADSYNTPEGER